VDCRLRLRERQRGECCRCADSRIETWFGILSRQAIRRGSFRSVKELIERISTFTAQWNEGSTPFRWVKTADQILAKAVRKPSAISESGH
jgi:hypothetical protein